MIFVFLFLPSIHSIFLRKGCLQCMSIEMSNIVIEGDKSQILSRPIKQNTFQLKQKSSYLYPNAHKHCSEQRFEQNFLCTHIF